MILKNMSCVCVNIRTGETKIISPYGARMVRRDKREGVIGTGVRRPAGSLCAGAVCLMQANACARALPLPSTIVAQASFWGASSGCVCLYIYL